MIVVFPEQATETMVAEPVVRENEEQKVAAWRYRQFIRIGFSMVMADCLVLAHADWHLVEELVTAGCPLDVAAEIAS